MGFMKSVKNGLKTTGQALGLVAPDVEKVDTSQSLALADAAAKNVKSAEQLTQEGSAVASNTAANAGTLASDQARNAMANAGGGRLARALVANQAAQEASQNAYNQNLQSATNLAQSQNSAQTDILAQKAGISTNAAQANAANQNAANQSQISNSIIPKLIGTGVNAYLTSEFGRK